MGRVAILKILHGSFQEGFEVSLEIKKDNGQSLAEIAGKLPANNNIENLYQSWQQSFDCLTGRYRNNQTWEFDPISTNISSSDLVTDCWQKVQQLEKNMQAWLQSSANISWQKIRERLAQEIAISPNRIRLIIKTSNAKLWKLPWHVWDLLLDYPHVGIGYSLNEHSQPCLKKATNHNKLRILAVFGDSKNIDLQEDRKAINNLQDTEVVFLQQPNSRKLIQQLRCDHGWDIFFFAGHSHTESDTGRIYINEEESLTIEQFQNALQEAITRGLKIAIFNSCDGLGLAKKLVADLHIPVVIVMQEIVPDFVAQSFLKEFLIEYNSGNSLYTAVRYAQTRLEEFTDAPGVTWLPLIVQNSSVIPPNWSDFLSPDQIKFSPTQKIYQKKLGQVIVSSFAIAGLVMGVRWFGLLQPLELYAYDHLIQLRSGEAKPDPRLLVVTIDNSDIKYQEQEKLKDKSVLQSLSDRTLDKLLDKLEKLNPTSIGLDIYHPHGFESFVANRLQNSQNFFTICKNNNIQNSTGDTSIAPPQELASQYWGFSDVLRDEDEVVRRHLLTMTPDLTDACNTNYSLSFLLALHYLSERENINPKLTPKGNLQVDPLVFWQKASNNAVFTRLKNHSSGYQKIDDRGFQILLNYRYYSSFEEATYNISLQQILTSGIPPFLKDKLQEPVILIGTTARGENYDDFFKTPYGREIPGVFLQAQMVSQILSKVLDNRPLLWWWSNWTEAIWIWGWSIMGGLLAIYIASKSHLLLSIVVSLLGIFTICSIVLTYGGWIPLIPPVLVLLINTLFVDRTIHSESRIKIRSNNN